MCCYNSERQLLLVSYKYNSFCMDKNESVIELAIMKN